MSQLVELPDLGSVLARYRFAYLMTTNAEGAPRALHVAVALEGDVLIVKDIGRRTRESAQARPAVGLVWPPPSESEPSLIVDGQAAVVGEELRITPTHAVLHRPAQSPRPEGSGGCGSAGAEAG